VTLRIRGIAHLVGESATNQRLLVVPNHKNLAGMKHDLLILVSSRYESELPGNPRTKTRAGVTYKFDDFPEGHEIDLKESGWKPPSTAKLTFSEAGDSPAVLCPSEESAPAGSLHWLPRLSTVSKATFSVKPDHKAKDPRPRDVLTRIEMVDGSLTSVMTSDPRAFEFDRDGQNGGGDHIQAIADALEFKFTAMVEPGRPFVLKGRKFKASSNDADTRIDLVRVVPQLTPAGKRTVEIELANVVASDFFADVHSAAMPHIDHYYDIIESPNRIQGLRKATCSGPVAAGDIDTMSTSGVECGPDRVP
jgi:hypothetical protein